mmetsp:Transcript_58105/g.138234  ORF Transcript_58105/g.138234 Transcript_58105/m.138234 type:complete len:1087 (-) Transcript_58105:131-3391(-)
MVGQPPVMAPTPSVHDRAIRFEHALSDLFSGTAEKAGSRDMAAAVEPIHRGASGTSGRELEARENGNDDHIEWFDHSDQYDHRSSALMSSVPSNRMILDRTTTRKKTIEERMGSQIDLMFVFPCPAPDDSDDDTMAAKSTRYSKYATSSWAIGSIGSNNTSDWRLHETPSGRRNPDMYTAPWYTKAVCKANFKDMCMRRHSLASSTQSPDNVLLPKRGTQEDAFPDDNGAAGARDTSPESYREPPRSVNDAPAEQGADEKKSNDDSVDEDDEDFLAEPDLQQLMELAKSAETMDELRRRIAELFIGYLVGRHCGFQARVFTGADGKELFVAVCASEAILRAHADALHVELQLDNGVASKLLSGGKVAPNEVVPPFVKYDVDEEEHLASKLDRTPFRLHSESYSEGSVFTSTDRIRIIMAAVKQAFHVDGMIEHGLLNCWYPVHNQRGLQELAHSWAMLQAAKERPAAEVRRCWHVDSCFQAVVPTESLFRYFGSKLAFDVAFIRFLIRQTLPLAVLLCPSWFLVPDAYHFEVSMVLGFILIVWSATIEEFWKRTESRLKMEWGVEGFSQAESTRHEFRGKWSRSPVDRTTMVKLDHPYPIRIGRYILTSMVTTAYMLLVVCTSLWLYNKHDVLLKEGRARAAIMVNAAIAVLLMAYNAIWDRVAEKLTIVDNYQTDRDHNEALLLRVFRCRFITSYVSLFYIAFLKSFFDDESSAKESLDLMGDSGRIAETPCIKLVRTQLRFFFAINMLYHGVAVAIPFFTHRIGLWWEGDTKECCSNKGYVAMCQSSDSHVQIIEQDSPTIIPSPLRRNHSAPRNPLRMQTVMSMKREPTSIARSRSYPEAQSRLPEYTELEAIADRMDVIVELGYVLFFGLVAPEVVLLFIMSTMIRLHAMGWKLVLAMRRPFPSAASGLGVAFEHVQVIMSQAAVACNVVLILITNAARPADYDLFQWLRGTLTTPDESMDRLHDYKAMLTMFMVLVGLILFMRFFIDFAIPDSPTDVLLQLERQKAIADEFQRRVVEDMKQWEGKELERAYHEAPERNRHPRVLTKAFGWMPVRAQGVVTSGQRALPWSPQDHGFEACEMF